MDFYRKEKNRVRTENLIRPMLDKKHRKVLKSLLCLPSGQCLDLKEMLLNGIINKKTLIIAIERSKKQAKKIRKFLEANFDNFVLHTKEFYSLKLGKVLADNNLSISVTCLSVSF